MIKIYKITNLVNRKSYVGQTIKPLEQRFMQHFKSHSPLGDAMFLIGLEYFTIEVLEECKTREKANEREKFYIKLFDTLKPNGYNRNAGGNFPIEKKVINLFAPKVLSEEIYRGDDIDKAITIRRYNELMPNVLHRHPHFEILYVLEGEYTFNIGFEILHLQRGDLIVTAPETVHTVEVFSDDSIIFDIALRDRGFYERFAPLTVGTHAVNKFFSEGLSGKSPIKYLLFHTTGDDFTGENILLMAKDQANADEFTEQFLSARLILGFVQLMRRHREDFELNSAQPSNLPDNFFIMSYIQENLATVTLEDVARQFNFSVSHCSRMIKAATGSNFNEWRKKLRLQRAQYLLTNTNQSIAEISSELGWLNSENFIRSFQKEFGTTPAKYRQHNKT